VTFNELKRRRRFAWLPWSRAEQATQVTWGETESEVNRRDAVERALAQLSPDYRAPLLLYSSYDFSVREIAEALGISEGAVKVRLYRARQMFRRVYDGDEA
jgi:RNA polymerase sigma-70 factor (ECF subfamily)